MKTALEWFEQLPEPIRSEARENFKADTDYTDKDLFTNLLDALGNGFYWHLTPQGTIYWGDISNRADAGEFDQPTTTPHLNGWIPVSERLPTVYDGDESYNIMVLTSEGEKAITSWVIINTNLITHWQPLPKLPEVRNGNN